MKKEELVEKLGEYSHEITSLKIKDENLRIAFAEEFNRYTKTSTFGYSSRERKVTDLSWENIFTEVGRLIGANNINSKEEEIKSLYEKIDFLNNEIINLKNI